jgi:hypothetical protein
LIAEFENKVVVFGVIARNNDRALDFQPRLFRNKRTRQVHRGCARDGSERDQGENVQHGRDLPFGPFVRLGESELSVGEPSQFARGEPGFMGEFISQVALIEVTSFERNFGKPRVALKDEAGRAPHSGDLQETAD